MWPAHYIPPNAGEPGHIPLREVDGWASLMVKSTSRSSAQRVPSLRWRSDLLPPSMNAPRSKFFFLGPIASRHVRSGQSLRVILRCIFLAVSIPMPVPVQCFHTLITCVTRFPDCRYFLLFVAKKSTAPFLRIWGFVPDGSAIYPASQEATHVIFKARWNAEALTPLRGFSFVFVGHGPVASILHLGFRVV